jgi:hypothetical protein
MTVRELIEHLAQFDSEMKVVRGDEIGEPIFIDHIDIENLDTENVVVIT